MELLLEKRELLSIDGDAEGLTLRCLDGELWLTQAGDSRDHILKRGDGFTVRKRGLIQVLAGAEARVRMEERTRVAKPSMGWQLGWG